MFYIPLFQVVHLQDGHQVFCDVALYVLVNSYNVSKEHTPSSLGSGGPSGVVINHCILHLYFLCRVR